jgi:uncharacterized protein
MSQQDPGFQPQPSDPTYPPAYPAYAASQPIAVSSEDRNYAVAAHLSAFLAAAIAISPLGPFVVYLIAKDRPFVRENAVEAFNFNLTMWIGVMISIPLMFVLVGFITAPAFGLAMLVFHIIGAMKASAGEVYRYPFSWRILK